MGRSLLLPDAPAGRAAVLGKILRVDARAGCARSAEVPGSKWIGTLGVRGLRLHGQAGAQAGGIRRIVYRKTPQRVGRSPRTEPDAPVRLLISVSRTRQAIPNARPRGSVGRQFDRDPVVALLVELVQNAVEALGV